MGFLDQKTRILDIVLTDKGRELLSKNQLNFTYYAFSDEGVYYSGSFVAASASMVSGSVDNFVHRNLAFEADQRKDSSLKCFLYTINQGAKILPEFKINVDSGSIVQLERRYKTETINLQEPDEISEVLSNKKILDVVIRAKVVPNTKVQRAENFVLDQKFNFGIKK